jgi:hypothetical protein
VKITVDIVSVSILSKPLYGNVNDLLDMFKSSRCSSFGNILKFKLSKVWASCNLKLVIWSVSTLILIYSTKI